MKYSFSYLVINAFFSIYYIISNTINLDSRFLYSFDVLLYSFFVEYFSVYFIRRRNCLYFILLLYFEFLDQSQRNSIRSVFNYK